MGFNQSKTTQEDKKQQQSDKIISKNNKEDWREKCYDPNDPTLKFVDEDDVLDFELDEYKSLRALMSCGHAVTPMSLTKWCRLLIDRGETTFVCGACDVKWSFDEVCKMALLTNEELKYFERKLFSNSKDRLDVKRCPGCSSFVVRTDHYNLCVKCTLCSTDKNRQYVFCWQCLQEWKGPTPRTDRCENDGCINTSVETLRNCPDTTFKNMKGISGCPSVRACPNCGFLIEHNTFLCKHIFCTRCRKKFCFVCLKSKEDCLQSSGSYEPCAYGVAPRQTSIPVWKT